MFRHGNERHHEPSRAGGHDGPFGAEVKAVQKLLPIHQAQLLSYLKLGRLPVGLLINFHVAHLRHGIKRMVN